MELRLAMRSAGVNKYRIAAFSTKFVAVIQDIWAVNAVKYKYAYQSNWSAYACQSNWAGTILFFVNTKLGVFVVSLTGASPLGVFDARMVP
jgi:hypothetical protein